MNEGGIDMQENNRGKENILFSKSDYTKDFVYEYNCQQIKLEFQRTIQKIRVEKKLSQQNLAEKTGLARQAISRVECFNGNPTLETLIKYLDGVGVNLVELISKYEDFNTKDTY